MDRSIRYGQGWGRSVGRGQECWIRTEIWVLAGVLKWAGVLGMGKSVGYVMGRSVGYEQKYGCWQEC